MFTTIKTKLLVILLLFALITVFTTVILFNYYQKSRNSISSITQKAERTHLYLLNGIKISHEFFENETINPEFFKTGRSFLIMRHSTICTKTALSIIDLNAAQKKNNFLLDDSLKNIEKDFKEYRALTYEIFKQTLLRGFKDFGVEGKMREYAHDLEKYHSEIGLINILQLRRHEKDFIIRQEDPYISKHISLVSNIKDNLAVNNLIPPNKKSEIIKTLNNYSTEFNNLVVLDKELGLKSGNGLKKQIDAISNKIETSLATLVEFSSKKEQAAILNVKITFLLISVIFIVIGIISAFAISKKTSKSITNLKEKIDEFVSSDFTIRTILPIKDSINEIDILATNFSIMEQHIVDQMNSLKLSNQNLERLFYAISKDMRRPLIKLGEITNRNLESISDQEAKHRLSEINKSSEQLISIVDELGIITNVTNVEIKAEPINLDETIRAIFSDLKTIEGCDDIIFSLEIKLENEFFSSNELIKAIFRNIIENSLKYATKRSGFSFLKICVSNQTEEMLKIEISDNGIGIKKECQDKIFDMFYRANSQSNGTGLGLYIVRCSVEKLHGAISVESSENTGTVFTILLPNNYEKKNIKERIIHNREMAEL